MTWSRFDESASVHAKCVLAGNDAASFWQWAVQWCNRNHTDGYIDGRLLHTVQPVPIAKELAKVLAELCVEAVIKPGGVGLMERAEDGAYIIHDFHDFQPPADEDLKSDWLSRKRSEAGRKGAEARWQKEMANRSGKTMPSPLRARASDRDGTDRIGSEDLEGSAEGGSAAIESLRDTARRAYGEGIRAVIDGAPFRVMDDEADAIVEVIAADPKLMGLRGARLAQAIRKSAHDYATARRDHAVFEKGFSARKWVEWLRAGQPSGDGRARPGPARAVQPAAETPWQPEEHVK